jgi:hypothetical protein
MDEEYRSNLEHFALERLDQCLDSNIIVIEAALSDINKIKDTARHVNLPRSIENALQLILDINGRHPHSLFEMIIYSLLNPSSQFWHDDDERVSTLSEKRNTQTMLIIQLYESIKGLNTIRLFRAYLQAPKLRHNPIKYFVYMLKIYNLERSGSYSEVKIVVTWLKLLGSTIEWFDQADEQQTQQHWGKSMIASKFELESYCIQHELFLEFWSQYIEPFLTEMNKFKNLYHSILDNQGHSYYLRNHSDEHVHCVKTFLLEIAKFLKRIYRSPDQYKQRTLCQNIAFAIENTVGKNAPINELHDSLTPFMIPYYMSGHDAY